MLLLQENQRLFSFTLISGLLLILLFTVFQPAKAQLVSYPMGLYSGPDTVNRQSIGTVKITSSSVQQRSVKSPSASGGTWTNVTTLAPHDNFGVCFLLSDGRVLCHSTGGVVGDIYDILTPDIHGSYSNGTWSQSAESHRWRFDFSSAVLKDGSVYVAGGEYGTDGTQAGSHAEVYNPVTNTWSAESTPGHVISDANAEILPDGRILQALLYDFSNLKHTAIYDPVTNSYSTGPDSHGVHNESMWVKLPDNSILMVDMQRLDNSYTFTTPPHSERYIPSLNTWVVDADVPINLYDPYGFETGPGFLLPDGRAFFMGSTGHTAYYTPSGTTSPGTWAAGPDIPNGYGMPDAGGSMMPNGKILFVCSPPPTLANHFPQPSYWYEFDYLTNTYTQINSPEGGLSYNVPSFVYTFLNLPDGKILVYINQSSDSRQYYIYTPDGSPVASGKPTINNITQTACNAYTIAGTQFNGIGQGSAYGDENQNSTNYPLVRLTSGSNVYYARTFNWNSTGVQRGNSPDTTYFVLPAGLPDDTYSLVVTTNGIASDPVTLTTNSQSCPFASTTELNSNLNPACLDASVIFTSTVTSNGNPVTDGTVTFTDGATVLASNVSLNGSGQATYTTSSLTSGSHTILASYNGTSLINPSSGSLNQLVNELPVVTFTGLASTICVNAGTVTLTGSPSGGTFSGTGISGNNFDPAVAGAGGPYAITYFNTDGNGCSNGSVQTVTVNPAPDVTQPGNQVVCNNGSTVPVNFIGSVTGTLFTWTNDMPSIGLGSTGSGNIPSFTATNATNAPVTATITVTPSNGPLTFNYTGSIQTWTAPAGVTSITITAKGAEGGNVPIAGSAAPGKGASMTGTFAVTPGNQYKILVGGHPSGWNNGGGGSFVTDMANNPLIVAGGGGGGSIGYDSPTKNGQAGTAGGAAGNSSSASPGGTGGNGGISGGGGSNYVGAGGGFYTDGQSGNYAGSGGKAYLNGGAGGFITGFPHAGFGGGGAGSGGAAGGGGGGYSGGGAAWFYGAEDAVGGGGGSYNAGTAQTNVGGENSGNGVVTIAYTTTTGCVGNPKTFTITVNPTPVAVATPSAQAICNGTEIAPIILSGGVAGTLYNWTRDNTATVTGIAASGSGDISGVLNNPSSNPVEVTFSITPLYTNGGETCTGTTVTATVTVNPTPVVSFTGLAASYCFSDAAVTLTGNPVGGTFSGPGITGNSFNPGAAGSGGTITYVYTDLNGCTNSSSQQVTTLSLDFVNLQWPPTSSICFGENTTVYGQVYEPGVTGTYGVPGAGIVAEFGYSTTNSDPSTWTTWTPATFNAFASWQPNDEYLATFGNSLSPGTYYYTFRFSLNGCGYQYGGYSSTYGGTWDGITNVSGVLVVNPLTIISLDPVDHTIYALTNTSFSVTATGASPLSYQWQVSTDGGFSYSNVSDGAVYSGSISNTLNLTNTPISMNGYKYQCVVTGACSTVTSGSALLTVLKRPTTLTYDGDLSVQYSDPVSLSATLIDDLSGLGLGGETITFTIGTQSTTAVTNSSGVASTSLIINQAPGTSYSVVSQFAGDINEKESSDSDPFTINREDAITEYTGGEFASTGTATATYAKIRLSASITDVDDGSRGDIRNALVRFKIQPYSCSSMAPEAIVYTSWINVSLVNLADATIGTAYIDFSLDIGSCDAKIYDITTEVSNYYTGNSDAFTITVAKSLDDFITGGGHLSNGAGAANHSGGIYKSTDNSKSNWGFNAKYNKKKTNLQGGVNIIIRSGGNTYQIKGIVGGSNGSLGVNVSDPTNKRATLTAKANMTDVATGLTVPFGSNATMELKMDDKGEPGANIDTYAITIWGSNNSLLYSSNWSGTKTNEVPINGGNIQVRSTSTVKIVEVTDPALLSVEKAPDNLVMQVYPNPTKGQFTLTLQIPEITDAKAKIQLVNMMGKTVYTEDAEMGNGILQKTITTPSSFANGLYIVRVIIDEKLYKTQLIFAR